MRIAGRDNAICEVIIHPPYSDSQESAVCFDIALLRLAYPVNDIEPLELFSGSDEVGRIVELPGWGDFGNGKKGVSNLFTRNDGLLRVAENRITAVNGSEVIFDFEPPDDTESLSLEGVPGPGDSGGPALTRVGDRRLIIGISSGGGYPELRWYRHRGRGGRYGWREYFARVSMAKTWIDGIVS